MAASIFDFLANFGGGGVRPNRYEVIINFPNGVGDVAITQKISFTCKATAIPEMTLGEIAVPYKGKQAKLPGDAVTNDWNVTIILDNDFVGRDVFETWVNKINGTTTNTADVGWTAPLTLFGNAVVKQLDREDKVIKTYYLQGIFPKSVGEIALGYDTNDAIAEQPVTFSVNGVKTNTSR